MHAGRHRCWEYSMSLTSLAGWTHCSSVYEEKIWSFLWAPLFMCASATLSFIRTPLSLRHHLPRLMRENSHTASIKLQYSPLHMDNQCSDVLGWVFNTNLHSFSPPSVACYSLFPHTRSQWIWLFRWREDTQACEKQCNLQQSWALPAGSYPWLTALKKASRIDFPQWRWFRRTMHLLYLKMLPCMIPHFPDSPYRIPHVHIGRKWTPLSELQSIEHGFLESESW